MLKIYFDRKFRWPQEGLNYFLSKRFANPPVVTGICDPSKSRPRCLVKSVCTWKNSHQSKLFATQKNNFHCRLLRVNVNHPKAHFSLPKAGLDIFCFEIVRIQYTWLGFESKCSLVNLKNCLSCRLSPPNTSFKWISPTYSIFLWLHTEFDQNLKEKNWFEE